MELGRQTALVTGASSGLGLEMARVLAARGYDLVLAARSADALNRLASEVESAHAVRTSVVPVDLAAPDGVERLLEPIRDRSIVVEFLVNNAGVGLSGDFAGASWPDVLAMLQLNVVALTGLTRALLPGMVERRRGRILNVGSTAGFFPGAHMAVYYATKAYVISFSEGLAEELAGSGVTVTALAPGPTRTRFAERAGVTRTNLFKSPAVMGAAEVARIGIDGALRGKRLVIPGAINRVVVQSNRISPRRLAAKIAARLNRES
jgi:short-subunit dehydrogenase